MPGEPLSRDLRAGEPAARLADTGADVSQDVALILDALVRMEATIRDDRATLGRLRLALGEMARAVARAKAAAPNASVPKGGATATLLDELEHRVDTMLEIAGAVAPQGSAQAPETDQVPTVSGVVSRLGPGVDAPDHALPKAAGTDNTPAAAGPDIATVSMLKTMVEALNAAAPAAPVDTDEADTDAAPQTPPDKPSASAPAQPEATQPDAAGAPHDPLAPLRAMSDEERIALFS
jgi:hypothetical protein